MVQFLKRLLELQYIYIYIYIYIHTYTYTYIHTHIQICLLSRGNTFQDLPRLRETTDNTERYI
jgi:hypothetical protein